MSRRFDIDWGESGLTLFYQITDLANNPVVTRTSVGTTEFPSGSGLYYVTDGTVDAGSSGVIYWDDNSSGGEIVKEPFGSMLTGSPIEIIEQDVEIS